MKFLDLIIMSITNLWRRKLRTILTILGVVIGTASIVVMLSIGFGLNKVTMEQIAQSGSLTSVTVYNQAADTKGSDSKVGGGSGSDKNVVLNDEAIDQIKVLEHVKVASPMLNVPIIIRQGAYEANVNLVGMSIEALEKMNLKFTSGSLPTAEDTVLKFVYGNQIITNFMQVKTGSGYYDTGELPPIDFVNTPMFVIYDMDAYYNAKSGDGAMPKKYIVATSGLLEGSTDTYDEHSFNVYCNITPLVSELKRIFRNKPIPGQPTTQNGKPYPELQYDQATVMVDKMANVSEVQKKITELGFQTYSNAEYLKAMQNQLKSTQAVLGGIGAVSLFVAAIGIANTMMMSIYERTKEIGVIKVLGCALGNIRTLFLMEAAFIGFIGGVFGIILSYLISAIVNHFGAALSGGGMGMGMGGSYAVSYIPLWLPLLSIGFAIVVGMIAGFFPALRAMRLSPLAAIRNE